MTSATPTVIGSDIDIFIIKRHQQERFYWGWSEIELKSGAQQTWPVSFPSANTADWNIIVFGYLIVLARIPQKVGIEQKISLLFDMRILFRWFKITQM
jgi:hypothetical protein